MNEARPTESGEGSHDDEEQRCSHGRLDLEEDDYSEEDPSHPASPSIPAKISWCHELSGACGDFGTLFPLLIALAREEKIHLAPTLVGTAIAHFCNAAYWNHLPMPLQPMHLISAQALGDSLQGPTQVAVAGLGMGICFLILPLGNGFLIEWLHRIIPQSVISGLQWGVGWKVAVKGINMIQDLPWWSFYGGANSANANTFGDCRVTAIFLSILTLYGLRERQQIPREARRSTTMSILQTLRQDPPVGLFLFGVGILLAILQLWLQPNDDDQDQDSRTHSQPLFVNALHGATAEDWSSGFFNGTFPQLPLTLLNSCLSVCLLVETLAPATPRRSSNTEPGPQVVDPTTDATRRPVSRTSVCWSIGLMNSILCPLGTFPHCHGAGGLAGQHKLGARTGASMMALGFFKLFLGLWATQGSLLRVLDALPVSVLGVLLALSGQELALTGIKTVVTDPNVLTSRELSSIRTKQNIAIALVTALVIVSTGMAHVGVLCGWLTYVVYGSGAQELCGVVSSRQDANGDATHEEVIEYSHIASEE